MKSQMIIAAAVAAAFATGAFAADEEQMAGFQADCARYAQEDGVPANEVEAYVAQCVRELVEAEAEGEASSEEKPSQE